MRVSNHIRSAVGQLSQHKQLSHDSLTTNDFGQITPVLAMPLLPRDKFKIKATCFSRVAPMIFPTYGKCDVVTNFHSVQYSQIWRDFDVFVSGQNRRGTQHLIFPVIKLSDLYSLFVSDLYSYTGDADVSNNDLYVVNANGTTSYRFLTLKGRYVRKVLTSLGYPFLRMLDFRTSAVERYLSALPFLSLVKVYHDFYESRQYASTDLIEEMLRQVYSSQTSSGSTYYSVGPTIDNYTYGIVNLSGISMFFDNYFLLYPSDYFTSAQAYPSLVGGSLPVSIPAGTSSDSPFYQSSKLVQSNNYTGFTSSVSGTSGSQTVIQSNPMHRLLDNFENLVRRYNLVGSREVDRIRALFGVRPTVQRNQYSTFHGGFSSPLQVQDVTSTSAEPSVDNYLGSYAGKGIVSDGSSFDISSDDFGFLIGLSFIRVRPLYAPGMDREVVKLLPTSYYNPDFDHGYSMAVAVGEVQSALFYPKNNDSLFQTFGYQNAYDEYRQKVSRVNGDFLDNDLLSWSFVRQNLGDGYSVVAQSSNVIYQYAPHDNGDVDNVNDIYNEFQRIFVDGSGRDHFYLYYGFDIDALRPVRTSSESFDLGVGDVHTSNNPVI